MEHLQPVHGQKYVGYYTKRGTEYMLEGICKRYQDGAVLVNENGEWVPFDQLTEESYPVLPLVEARIRKKTRRFLREEIDKDKFLDKLESLPDDQQEDLMTALLATVEADAEEGDNNDDIVADEVASELEAWVTGEPVEEEEGDEEVTVTEDVETMIEALFPRRERLQEATVEQITRKLLKILDGPLDRFFDFMKRTATQGWEDLIRGIQKPSDKNEVVNLRGAILRLMRRAKQEAPKNPQTGLVKVTQNSIKNLIDTLKLGITVDELAQLEQALPANASANQVYSAAKSLR